MSGSAWAREQWDKLHALNFPPDWSEEERSISGELLLEIILDPRWARGPVGLVIMNAVVTTRVSYRHAEINSEVTFKSCVFNGEFVMPLTHFRKGARFLSCTFEQDVILTGAQAPEMQFGGTNQKATVFRGGVQCIGLRISGNLYADNAEFQNKEKPVFFSHAKIEGSAFFRHVHFHGLAYFDGIEVDGQLSCKGVRCLEENSPVHFTAMRIGREAFFNDAIFLSCIEFGGAKVGHQIVFTKAQLLNEKEAGNFDGVQVGGEAIFGEALCQGTMNFRGADISGRFIGSKAQFTSRTGSVIFNGARLRRGAFFQGTTFQGSADFTRAEIGVNLECQGVKFANPESQVAFNGITIGGSGYFQDAVFEGAVSFTCSGVGGQLVFDRSQFHCKEEVAGFNGVSIKGGVFFEKVVFWGGLDFTGATIGSALEFQQAQFLSEKKEISFNGVMVTGNAVFVEAVFHGPVHFEASIIHNRFICERAKFLSAQAPANFIGLKVGGIALLGTSIFQGPVELRHCRFADGLSITGTKFSGFLNFSNTSVLGPLYVFSFTKSDGEMVFFNTQLPPQADLRGLTYERTDLEYYNRWKDWLRLRRTSNSYDPNPYLTLEHSFRLAGRNDIADRVHFSMRLAESEALWGQRRFGKWLGYVIWRFFVGYGVSGWRLLLWMIPLPTLLFIHCRLSEPSLNPLWVLYHTLDVFLPIDLGQKQYCNLEDLGGHTLRFMTELWGWLIIPAMLAYLGGFLKKKE